jgi:hypothetical protein
MTRSVTLSFLVTALASVSASAAPHTQSIRTPQPNVTAGTVCNDVPHLGYPAAGGPLIQHVKVVDVFYSPGAKYKTMLEDFYKAILQSGYMDWLIEYNVANYKIGRGTFVTSFEDTNANPTTVKKVNPETYLKGLLAVSGKLPPPDDDTIYMLYFPSGIDPDDGTGGSCISNGNYCAYHSSYVATGGQNVRYGVMPDMEAGACKMGCGPAGFPSFTDVSSHELIEAITDPDATGWYDDAVPENDANNCGEIGDICAVGGTAETATIGGFIVQKEWSNKNKACIGTDPNVAVNDFTITLSPSEISVPLGGSATVTVTLTKKSGVAESVALTAPAPPTGLAAAFMPASATSDSGTSTLTVSAGGALTPGASLALTVKGAGSSVSETATLNVAVVAAPDMASSGNGNGGSGGNGSGDHGASGGCSVAGRGASPHSCVMFALLLCGLMATRVARRRAP